MEAFQIMALRDFAIEHFPQGQKVKSQRHSTQADYHYALYSAAALANLSASGSAIEQAAITLLQHTLALVIDRDEKPTAAQRRDTEHLAIKAANTLCALTGTSLPWLDAVIVNEPPETAEPLLATPITPKPPYNPALPPLQPGEYLSTKDAAAYLNRKPQTLQAWSSKGTGPIQPTRGEGRLLIWRSDDVLRVLEGK